MAESRSLESVYTLAESMSMFVHSAIAATATSEHSDSLGLLSSS